MTLSRNSEKGPEELEGQVLETCTVKFFSNFGGNLSSSFNFYKQAEFLINLLCRNRAQDEWRNQKFPS